MYLRTLYHETKSGKIQQWRVWTAESLVITEYGLTDGKKQITSKVVKGKNLGKKNETTPQEQAIIKATQMHTHRLERKYSLTEEEARETVYLPMLAHNFDDKKHRVTYPVDAQPKLDGDRCMAYWVEDKDGSQIELLSRGGKVYDIPHITDALAKMLPEGFVVDGEVYKHGVPLQRINSLIKKHREVDDEEFPEGSESLEFHIYDGFYLGEEKTPWEERQKTLEELLADDWRAYENGPIKKVMTEELNSEEEVRAIEKKFVKAGFEGAIIRLKEGVYLWGHRSSDLLKVKSFKEKEFEIVGHYYGTGRAAKAVIWKCLQEEGLEFNVVPMGTMKQREKWGTNPEKYYEKMLKVKFWNRTEDNKPQFGQGVCIRLEEDM